MDCSTQLQHWGELAQFRNSSMQLEDFKYLLTDCSQVCDVVYGNKDFELGGIGIFISVAICAVSFLLLGTLQSLVSYIVPSHARSGIRLTIARLQLVFNKAYGACVFLHLGVIVTSYVRLRLSDGMIGTYERSTIQDLLEILSALQTIAITSHMVQQAPARIKSPAWVWSDGKVWLMWIVTTFARDWLKSQLGKTPLAVISKICEESPTTDDRHYPYVCTLPTLSPMT